MSGRKPTKLLGHNYLDCRIHQDSIKQYDIDKLVKEMIIVGIIDDEEPYAYGLDKVNDVVKRAHYHIRGKTKILTSRIKKLITDSEILSSVPRGQGHMMITSKMPDDDRGDFLSFLAYCGKDTLIDSTVQLDIKTASDKYKIKLKRLKEKELVKNEGEDLHSYITKILDSRNRKPIEIGIGDIDVVKSIIVEYALENDKRYIMNRTNLNSYALMYLGQKCFVASSQIVDYLEGKYNV